MLILYQQHSSIDYLLVLIIVDHFDIAGLGHHVEDFYHADDYQVENLLCSILDQEFVIYL